MSMQSDLDRFMKRCIGYLSLTSELIERAGDRINVGETFVLRFTLKNELVAGQDPDIAFIGAMVVIDDTEFAEVADPRSAEADLVVERLNSGESATLVRRFTALRTLAGTGFFGALRDVVGKEDVAHCRIYTQVDLAKGARAETYKYFREEIAVNFGSDR